MKVTRRTVSPPFNAFVPINSVIYAIGDIHGRADLWGHLRQAIGEDAERRESTRKVLVYLGDYSGRGPDTRRLLDMLIEHPLPGFETVFLKGNHEELILRMLDGDLEAARHWLTYGGREMLASYDMSAPKEGEVSDRELAQICKELSERTPSAHLGFLRLLSVSHREGDYFFVHAGIRPGTPIVEQTDRDMIWIRKRFLESDDSFGVVVVHGHSVSEEPVIKHNRIGIDTGAHASGRLTAAVLEKDTCAFMQASSD